MAMITTSIAALKAALPGRRVWELDITRRGRPYIHEKLEAELGVTDDQQPIPLLAVLNTCGLSDAVWALRATAVDPSLLRQYLYQTLVELRMVFVDHPYLLETLALTRKLLHGEFDAVGWETQFMACRTAFLAKDQTPAPKKKSEALLSVAIFQAVLGLLTEDSEMAAYYTYEAWSKAYAAILFERDDGRIFTSHLALEYLSLFCTDQDN